MRSWIAFLLCLSVEIAAVPQKEVIVTMQTKRWTHILSDHFLSLTVTPEIALQLEDFSKSTMNMLKGLSPTMLRLGGPSTDKMKFMPEKISSDNFTITDAQWRRLNQFIEDVNLNLIVCLNSKERVHGVWESHDAVELIYSSEKKGYKLGWELGYESQNLLQDGVTGSQLGRDVARLKKILGDFSMYTDSPIIGPDMISLSTPEEVRFLREYLEESADFLTAITWHPQFSSVNAENEDVGHKFLRIIHDMESMIWNRNNGLRSPIQPPPKKPIWLAESDTDEYTGKFADSLTWMKRLGAAARLGFPVIMKKLTAASLTTTTPDYWVSLLYKTLVGRAVMDVKYLAGSNRSTLQVFSHCAHVADEESSLLTPGLRYTQGSAVLYGLNLDEQETRLTVRGSVKEEIVHKYVLTAEQLEEEGEETSEEEEEAQIRKHHSPQKTLLNGQLLSLLPNGDLPTISPVEMRPTRTLSFNIPGRSVFFFVLPDMRLKTCMSFTNIQGSVEKINNLEKGLNLKSSTLGVTRPEEGSKFNFVPVGNNLESRLPTDVHTEESWKPPNFGVGLRGRFPDVRLNRGLVGLPRPRIILESDKPKTLENVNVLQDQTSTSNNMKPVEKTSQNDHLKEEATENGLQSIDDNDDNNGRAISHTRFVMFSDDDWLSDFTRAQESVELARKAIAAFDEAKLQEAQKSPQNTYEEQIMNQKMSPTRRRIYEALTNAASKKNTTKIGSDRTLKNSEINLNGSDKDEKVYNRERRDNMVQELSYQNMKETPVIMNNTISEREFDKQTQNKTGDLTSNIMTIVRSNDIPKISPVQKNQTLEHLNTPQIPIQNSSFETSIGNGGIGNQINITIDSQSKENISSVINPQNPAHPKNIEIDEMVLKADSKEENNCFGHIESDLEVITENSTQNDDIDKMLKMEAERELNNYFEGISIGEVSLDGIDASDESGESVEKYDDKDLQRHSIVLESVNDKSCKASNNNSTNGTQNDNDKVSLKLPSSEEVKEKQSTEENKLQTTDLPEEVVLSENDKRADRGRREMYGSPFNYYNSRYNTPNQLTLREIKELIDELAARKRELNYVMLNQRKTPEMDRKIYNFEESATDQTELDNDSSSGPMQIKIEDTVQGTESPIDDKVESTDNDDFSNVRYSIVEDENKFEQTNRLYRQPQSEKISIEGVEGSNDKDVYIEETQDDSRVGTPLTSQSTIESSTDHTLNTENKYLEDTEPEKVVESSIPLSVARKEESQSEKSDDKIQEKTPDLMDGDIHLTEVNSAPEIPTTYSKVMSVMQDEDKNSKIEKGKELGSVKTNKVLAPIATPKINATQLRLERIEALRNRILESRKKILKSNPINTINKSPEILKKVPIVKSNAPAATTVVDDKAPSGYSHVGAPNEPLKKIPNEKSSSENAAVEVDEKVSSGYLEEGAPTCKASRAAPYVEGIENWIDKIERDSEETVRDNLESQQIIEKHNVSPAFDKIDEDKEISQDKPRKSDLIENNKGIIEKQNVPLILDVINKDEEISQDKPRKIDLIKSNRLITGTNKLTNKINGLQIASSIITKNQENDGLSFEDIDSPFIIIPTSYAIMPIKPKGSRAAKNVRGYRSYPLDSDVDDSPFIGQGEGSQDIRTYTDLDRNDRKELRTEDIIPCSFPLMVEDPEFTESYIESYGREKRSPEETEENNEKMLNRGLLNVKGLNRGFKGFRANFKLGDKLQSVAPKLSLEEIRSRALARINNLRESLKSARLKTPIKSRETRAISNIEGRAKVRSAHTLSDDMETNEIPKRHGEYIDVYEPRPNDRLQLSSAEFEKKMKTYSRSTPLSSRKSSIIHLDDIGREKQVSAKDYTDNDYLVERMSMTDRAVVGLKHSVEELENTAKEILDKFRTSDYSNVEERKKPSLSNILQNTFRIGRPKEPKRTGALAFLNPIIDLALKFMRSLGIISNY